MIKLEYIFIIIIFILLIIIVNLYYKKCKIVEKLDGVDQSILDAINKIYKADIEAIRNLSSYATYLMGGNSAGSNVTIPSALTATTSFTTPTVNATTVLNTPTVNASIALNTPFINMDGVYISNKILYDLLNAQSGTAFVACGDSSRNRTITFIKPFNFVPLVHLSHSSVSINNSAHWRHYWHSDVTTTGFKLYYYSPEQYSTISWTAMYSQNNKLSGVYDECYTDQKKDEQAADSLILPLTKI